MVYIYMRANYNSSQTWNKASWENSPNHYSRVESGPEVVIVYPYIYTLHIHIHPGVDRIWKFQEILTKTGKCQKDGVSMCVYIYMAMSQNPGAAGTQKYMAIVWLFTQVW